MSQVAVGLKKVIFELFLFLLFYPLTDKIYRSCVEQSVDQSIIDIIVRGVHVTIDPSYQFSEKSDIV